VRRLARTYRSAFKFAHDRGDPIAMREAQPDKPSAFVAGAWIGFSETYSST
jgi:hypothetical protein